MAQFSDLFPSRYQHALEGELRETLAGQEGLFYNMLLYQLGWIDEQGVPRHSPSTAFGAGPSGQRLHPVLCLLSCEALLGEFTPALPAAAAIELVHNFRLIHEDIQSGNPNRGQHPTVWWIWGPGQAINAGDGMHALARLALMRLQDRGLSVSRVLKALRLLDQSCLSMCEGQHLDLAFQERLDVGVDAYFKMVAGKTGALMSCALGLGALVATEDDKVVEAFKECGKNLGIAWQIREDIQDLSFDYAQDRQGSAGEQALSSDVLNKKKLLPIVYTLESGDLRTKRELGNIYFKRVLEPQDVQQIVNILNERLALEYAQERARDYCRTAMESLEGVGLSLWAREELEKLCQHIVAGAG